MGSQYVRQTDQRSRSERILSARPEHRSEPDRHLLTESLIRRALRMSGERRATQTAKRTNSLGARRSAA